MYVQVVAARSNEEPIDCDAQSEGKDCTCGTSDHQEFRCYRYEGKLDGEIKGKKGKFDGKKRGNLMGKKGEI